MICENGYKLKLTNGQNIEFNNDLELDAYIDDELRKHPGAVNIDDFATRAVDFQKNTIDILNEISSEVSSVSQLVTYIASDDPEDEVSFYKIPNSIGVNRFLQTFIVPSTGDPFTVEFNKDSWRLNRIEFLTNEFRDNGIANPEQEAIKAVEKEEAAWNDFSETGTEVHKIYEMVFKGESYSNPNGAKLSNELFDKVKQQASELKQQLIQKHGSTAKFYTEFGIISKELTPDIKDQLSAANLNSINGKIDLLVIDQYGKAHIYDFKVSRHDVGDWDQNTNKVTSNLKWWHSTKKRNAALQLAFYAKILQQRGIDVVSASIIPIKTDYLYEDAENEIGIKKLQGISRKGIINVPDVLAGKYNSMAKEVFPNSFSVTGWELTNWAEAFNKLFPAQSVKKYQENLGRDVEWYKNNKDYTQILLPSDTRYRDGKRYAFRKRGLDNRLAYAKTEEELNDIIAEYILALSTRRSDMCLSFANRIKEVQRGNLDFDNLADEVPVDSRPWVKSQFKRYFDEHWIFNEDDVLNANGIFIFEKGNVSEIVMLSEDPLSNVINLGVGTTILGKNTKDTFVNKSDIFESSYGHIRLMEIMVYVSQNQDKFQDKKIQQIRVINPTYAKETSALNSQLIKNYNQLKLKNPDVDLNDLDSGIFIDDVTALIEGAKSRLMALDPNILDLFDVSDCKTIEDFIDIAIARLENKYGNLYKWDENDIDMSDPKWQAFTMLGEAKNFLHGIESHNESDKGQYMTKGGGLAGTMVSSLQYSPSTNLRELGQIIDKFSSDVSKQCYSRGFKMQGLFRKVYDKHGNGTKAFENWFRRDANGKLDERLLFVDPDSSDFDGSPEDREALSTMLEILNELRFGKLNDADKAAYKASLQWYELPLTEATAYNQAKSLGIVTAVKNKWQQFTTLTKDVFAEDEEIAIEHNRLGKKLYNKFDLTSGQRLQKIKEQGAGKFDLNVERVFNQALVSYVKADVSQEYLPLIAGLRLSIKYRSSYGHQKMDDILKTFDKAVYSKVFGESIVPTEVQPIYKFVSFIRKGFTRMALSLNFTSFFRETLQGIYSGAARAGIKMLPGINEKYYLKALEYVIKEAPKNTSGVSMLQQLNVIYKMANQSMSSIAQNRRVNWLNINNWNEDTLFLTATAPDFLHRVSILVAKMMGDGCWEAHSIGEDGELIYDFKKDGRFQHYLNKETSHSDYLKEKSLYLEMIDRFNQEGYRKADGSELKIGDDLPQAYTQTEANSIKNFGDLLYGHYDEESKSLFCDTFLGSFIMQYKTFLTSKLEQWTMAKGIHNTELLKQQFDPETGEELYQVITYDEDNNPHRKIKRKSEVTQEEIDNNNARVYYDYEGIPMNGILWESATFMKHLLTLDGEKLKEMWNNPVDRGYLLIGLHDQFIMMLLAFIVTFITGEFADVDEPTNPAKVRAAIRKMGPVEQLTYNVLWGSTQDSQINNIIGNFTQNPPLITQIQRFGTSCWQAVTGTHSIPYIFTNNIGAIRNFNGLVLTAEDLAKQQ